MSYDPTGLSKIQLFKSISIPADKVGIKRGNFTKTVYEGEQFKEFVRRSISRKKILTRAKLLVLISNHGRNASDLDELLANDLNNEIIVERKHGIITQSGDGKTGALGNGAVTYHWGELPKWSQKI